MGPKDEIKKVRLPEGIMTSNGETKRVRLPGVS